MRCNMMLKRLLKPISTRSRVLKWVLVSQRGVALLIVLSSLMILTTAVVEFSYSTRINYRLAVQNKERLQAYYLAKSAVNFSKIILKLNKEAEKALEQYQDVAGGMDIEPLYRMVPLSSELFRGLVESGGSGIFNEGGDELEAADAEEGETKVEEGLEIGKDENGEGTGQGESGVGEDGEMMEADVSMLDKEAVDRFLSFEGDFSSSIWEEQTQYDLNKISGIETTSQTYDNLKKVLLSILRLQKFKSLFEESDLEEETLVHALSDWVDSNTMINEFGNIQRGGEDRLYLDHSYETKNGKMITKSEMRLVAGMNDALYTALSPHVTVYSGTDKINVCLAPEMLEILIYHYSQHAGCTSRVDYEDEERMKELVDAVLGECPDESAMASALNLKLGLSDSEDEDEDEDSKKTDKKQKTLPGEVVPTCSFQFKDLITGDNKVFTVKGTGTVGETEVNITTVLNTADNSPSKWSHLYFRVE